MLFFLTIMLPKKIEVCMNTCHKIFLKFHGGYKRGIQPNPHLFRSVFACYINSRCSEDDIHWM